MSKPIVTRSRKQVYKRWIAALRNGEYKQTRDTLRRGDSFCCLGVLCDLARKDGGPEWDAGSYMDNEDSLPAEIETFIRLTNDEQTGLIKRNDAGQSFLRIADHIEYFVMPNALERS